MRKVLLCFVSLFLLFATSSVYAEEVYYINNYGMPFTKFQYDAMVATLDEDLVANMTYTEYQAFRVDRINEDSYTAGTYDDTLNTNTRGSFHETTCKKITLSITCDSVYCLSVLTTNWKCTPAVKSYDVTGIRLANTNYYEDGNYMFISREDGDYDYEDGLMGASNGLGYAFKLPSSGDVDYAMVSATVLPKGVVFGSYQHAVKTITLSQALDFTFSAVGFGGVFLYDTSYNNTFDQMGGVYVQLPVN